MDSIFWCYHRCCIQIRANPSEQNNRLKNPTRTDQVQGVKVYFNLIIREQFLCSSCLCYWSWHLQEAANTPCALKLLLHSWNISMTARIGKFWFLFKLLRVQCVPDCGVSRPLPTCLCSYSWWPLYLKNSLQVVSL